MRPSSPGETKRLASLPIPPVPLCLCLACASVPILGQRPLVDEGIRELFLQGPICLQDSNDPCANSLPQT